MNKRIDNLQMEEYRALPGLSKHRLDWFAVSPMNYQFRKSTEIRPSRSMEIGTLLHSAVLEGNVDYALGPVVDRRTKEGKLKWEEFCQENLGKTIVNSDEFTSLEGMREAASKMLNQYTGGESKTEVSFFWERDLIQCKGRPDLLCQVNGKFAIIDLKMTAGLSFFDSKFFAFRYDIQAAWYAYGVQKVLSLEETPEFYFLMVDSEAPHHSQFIHVSRELRDASNIRIDRELANFKKCQDEDQWPGLPAFRTMAPKRG